jgi:hypothetical protein
MFKIGFVGSQNRRPITLDDLNDLSVDIRAIHPLAEPQSGAQLGGGIGRLDHGRNGLFRVVYSFEPPER